MSKIEVTFVDSMGSCLSVVNAARVSFGKKSEWEGGSHPDFDPVKRLSERDTKLIKYLAKHKHISPFGHAFASFHIKAPIFVARQLVKHKFLRWNEISRRYVDDEPEFYVPSVWRGKSADKKQGSSEESVYSESTLVQVDYDAWDGPTYRELNDIALGVYKDLIADRVAPEMARMVLPQSTLTEWYWSGSLDAFAAMCRLRCAPDTQYESRLVADQVSTIMQELFPVSWSALISNS